MSAAAAAALVRWCPAKRGGEFAPSQSFGYRRHSKSKSKKSTKLPLRSSTSVPIFCTVFNIFMTFFEAAAQIAVLMRTHAAQVKKAAKEFMPFASSIHKYDAVNHIIITRFSFTVFFFCFDCLLQWIIHAKLDILSFSRSFSHKASLFSNKEP